MKCEFSETQFAFCYVFELIKNNPTKFIMPWFPNTVQEGREGGGYDVKINLNPQISGSIFLQFKIPVHLKTKQKYKINIDTRSKQFELLKKLKRPANLVYYCAPKFHTVNQINNLYVNNEIEKNSALFPIEAFPCDNKQHRLIYEYKENSGSYGELFSKPQNVSAFENVFCGSFNEDSMSLRDKARFVLDNIVNKTEAIPDYLSSINEVDLLFLILLFEYNILWIPIKNKSHAMKS